jgi:hypothetical protein
MERVVYILGAGFSAPLGIPTVANFIDKAKDLYFSSPATYPYFKATIDDIDSLARTLTKFKSNLDDLEEVLSILQIESEFGGKRTLSRAKRFVRMITDVIEGAMQPLVWTPDLADWHERLVTDEWGLFLCFIGHLFTLHIEAGPSENARIERPLLTPQHSYDIISLNYDCVLEIGATFIATNSSNHLDSIGFARTKEEMTEPDDHRRKPMLVKLHGCCSRGNIVAPTANKGLSKLKDQWQMAYSILSKANHIRVLGYSLPEGDAAVRYLLKSAVSKSQHLKSFDIICRDPTSKVEGRYNDFLNFAKKQFYGSNVTDYFDNMRPSPINAHNDRSILLHHLQQKHENFVMSARLSPHYTATSL